MVVLFIGFCHAEICSEPYYKGCHYVGGILNQVQYDKSILLLSPQK